MGYVFESRLTVTNYFAPVFSVFDLRTPTLTNVVWGHLTKAFRIKYDLALCIASSVRIMKAIWKDTVIGTHIVLNLV